MSLSKEGKEKLEEFRVTLDEAEELIFNSLQHLGLTYDEFITLTNQSSNYKN